MAQSVFRWLLWTGGYFFFFGMTAAAQPRSEIVPDYLTIQYAGSTGWLSAGVEYHLFKNQRGRAGGFYGYVPERAGGSLHIATATFFYQTLAYQPSERLTVRPLDLGLKLSYHFGEQFRLRWPDRYPPGYYWWSTALRPHLAVQSSVMWKLPSAARPRAVAGYVELNTNDFYLVSFFQNPTSIRLTDIFKLGLGARFRF